MASSTVSAHVENSTNVRPDERRWIRRISRGLDLISPALSARAADWIFFRPPRLAAPERERAWLTRACRTELRVGGHRIVAHAWGEGPTVVLVHGWAGRAGQMGAIGAALAGAGFRAVAFDGPGHGESSGRAITIVDLVAIIEALAEQAGGLHGVVGHSMGGAATVVALARGVPAEAAVILGAPSTLEWVVSNFAEQVGLSPIAAAIFRERLETRFGADIWRRFSPVRLVAELRVAGLVVHDRADREVPHAQAEHNAQAWPGAQVFSTDGLGHTRMLREPMVVDRLVGHMSAARAAADSNRTISA